MPIDKKEPFPLSPSDKHLLAPLPSQIPTMATKHLLAMHISIPFGVGNCGWNNFDPLPR